MYIFEIHWSRRFDRPNTPAISLLHTMDVAQYIEAESAVLLVPIVHPCCYSHFCLKLSLQPLCNAEVSFHSTACNSMFCIHVAAVTAALGFPVMAVHMVYCFTSFSLSFLLWFHIRFCFVLSGTVCYRLFLRLLISIAATHIVRFPSSPVYGRKQSHDTCNVPCWQKVFLRLVN
jgi:hypothetical protein